MFRYIRNEVNIGGDANFLQCFRQSTGKYFWIVGDDDVLAPGAVKKILALLQSPAAQVDPGFDLIYLSSFEFSNTYDPERQPVSRDPFGRFAEIITDGRYFLDRVHALITLLSCIIVNKDRLLNAQETSVEDLGSCSLQQLAWTLPLVRRKARILYVWERLVGYRVLNSAGWGPCQVFGVNLPLVASRYYPADPALVQSLMNGVIRYWFPAMLFEIRRGRHPFLLQENSFRRLYQQHSGNWRYWLFLYPVAAWPLWSARLAYRIIGTLNKAWRAFLIAAHHYFKRPTYLTRA